MASFEDMSEEQLKAHARAMHKLLNNPEVSPATKRLLMKADPSLKFAEIEAEDRANDALKSRDEKITALEAKQIEQEARERRAEKHRQAIARGLDPADVEKTVTEYKVMDWDKAMEITERLQTVAAATPESPYDAVKMPDTKELWENPDAWAKSQATAAINDLRGRKRAH